MKKKTTILTLLGLLFIWLIGSFYIHDIFFSDEYIQPSILKIGGDNNFPPFEYVDENGDYTGFNVDIIRAIALNNGIELKFYPMTWDEACEKLKDGEIDAIEGMKNSQEREKYYSFSEEYLENSQSIFVMESNDSVTSFESLDYNKVAIQKNDVAINNLKTLKNVKMVLVNDQELALKQLMERKVDAYIGNTLTGVYLMNKLNARDKVRIVDKPINPTKYSIAVKKGNKEVLDIVNRGLKDIKNNGTYEVIYRKWFGYTIAYPNWYVKKIFVRVAIIIGIFIVLVGIFYRWNHLLKKEVKNQTLEITYANKDLLKKNKQIIKEKEFRETIMNEIFSGIVTISKEGRVTFVNKLAKKILNIKNDVMIGRSFKDTLIYHVFGEEFFLKNNGEKEILINGKKRIIDYKINSFSIDNICSNETIIIFRDVTEEKLMQENIKTKDKMQSLGNLVSGIAHEIRNPLTSIKTYSELIPKKYDNPKFREMISKDIPKEIVRLNSLINDLLEYSKPRKPFKERINLYNELNSITVFLNDRIKKENINFKCNVEKNIFVSMDKNHFRQVLINIILNAIESLDKNEKSISISSKSFGSKVILFIEDNGCGIDEQGIDKIYNPFYTTKPSGTGLGLFVCYQLLNENRVKIAVDSIKGKGTKFAIEFNEMEED